MKRFWSSLNIATKLNIPIQVMLTLVLTFAHVWELKRITADILTGAQQRAEATADGIINGLNMLMLTGMISVPENRRLFIAKMGASEKVKALRIVRAKQVQEQYGPGLPEEQIMDDLDRTTLTSKRPQFRVIDDQGRPALRAVVPFMVSANFRGTNCLQCHQVAEGSVNGAASMTFDMADEFSDISERKALLWIGQVVLQILLYFSIHWLIHRFLGPLRRLQTTMEAARQRGSMDQFVPVAIGADQHDEIAKLTSVFNEMAASLGESEKLKTLAASIYQTNTDAIIVTDEHNAILDINPMFTRITGYTRDEVIGKNPRLLKSGRHDDDFYREMWRTMLAHGRWQGEVWNRRKDGTTYPAFAHFQILRRADGRVFRHVGQFSDITERKQKDDLIFWQANYDPLTGLPNRRLLSERLAHALVAAKHNARCGALTLLDLGRFKSLNDTLGRAYGEMLLTEAAKRLKSCVRQVDDVAYLGGDEFAVLIENIASAADDAVPPAASAAATILAALATPYQLGHYDYLGAPSIGVYLYDGIHESVDEALNRAAIAMHQARDSGRNAARFFDPHMQQLLEARAVRESDLRRAIPERQFQLYYQLQRDRDQRVLGAEALIRWNHPRLGTLAPGDFISCAEGTPLILEIGNWVLDAACRQLAEWSEDEHTRSLVLAINVSAHQFQEPDFVGRVAAVIRQYGIRPACLKLELTEGVALDDIDAVVGKMRALRDGVGVTLSLDDFGTGYSSLSYLKRLPLDQIKIDRSFVCDLPADASDAVMVKTIIAMAQNFGLHVIAEGVETWEQHAFLEANGCMAFQGYLLGKPMPINEFEASLALAAESFSEFAGAGL